MVGWLTPLRPPPAPLQMIPPPLEETPRTPDQKKKLVQLEESLLMADWEYLLSATEQICRSQSENRSREVHRELEKITRVSNTVKYRSRIGNLLKDEYAILPVINPEDPVRKSTRCLQT